MGKGPDDLAGGEAAPKPKPMRQTGPRFESSHAGGKARLWGLTLGSLGVVFGDIGTSPLYALRECFFAHEPVAPTPDHVLGVLSLLVWSLTFVVGVKYVAFMMRADNRGEGGIFALLALLSGIGGRRGALVVLAALASAALFFGDGIITPAISVVSAVEGLATANPGLEPMVMPLSLVIIVGLFAVQRQGAGRIGFVFGPIMCIWFAALALLGLRGILDEPQVLAALSPHWAFRLIAGDPRLAMTIMGSGILVITGAEALYADLGHFGRRPITLAWFGVSFPALLLNYLGQGAVLLRKGDAIDNPFYALVPGQWRVAMVILSTMAATIASQAMISGIFSITRQAIQLGFLPRLRIIHTSAMQEGQIYMPAINLFLLFGCLTVTLGFGSSSALAGAYGVAVTAVMLMSGLLFCAVARHRFRWPLWACSALCGVFLAVDLPFLAAALTKIVDGGWFPIVLGLFFLYLMRTWNRGRQILGPRMGLRELPLEQLVRELSAGSHPRVSGSAVFLAASGQGTPVVLLHHLKHNKVLHRQVILLTFRVSEHQPFVPEDERLSIEDLSPEFHRVCVRHGYMEVPSVVEVFDDLASRIPGLKLDSTSFYLSRRSVRIDGSAPMNRWRKRLYAFLVRNELDATSWFGLPPGRTIELGITVAL